MLSTLTLSTTDGARISKRLFNHWRHKMDAKEETGKTIFPFSDEDTAIFNYNDNELTVQLTTETEEAHTKLQSVILNHINRMAGAEFEANWVS